MNLELIRQSLTDQSTIGELAADGVFQCFTLEDPVRPVKIKGITAIPAGNYNVVVTFSPKFKKLLPLLENVPNFEGVRIHTGNTPADTLGCILVGRVRDRDAVRESRLAFQPLFEKIQSALKTGKVTLTIR